MTSPAYRFLAVFTVLGLVNISPSAPADEIESISLSQNTLLLLGRADRGLKDLNGFLRAIEFENPAIIGINYFALSVGGIDAVRDLEEGRGVDPETFAGLLAGFARPSVAEHLNLLKIPGSGGEVSLKIDAADGRLRYKGTVVRLYSPTRLAALYDRREGFRLENIRKRRAAFAEFVANRRTEQGIVSRQSDKSEVKELSDRYQQLQPILSDLSQALEAETGGASILQGGSQHFFGLSVGGINAVTDLTQRSMVDPETLGAIYAQRISADYADAFQYPDDGRIFYEGSEVRLYSVEHLERSFKLRERLAQQAAQ